MAIQRANPLPVGAYWIDVFEPKAAALTKWLAASKGKIAVRTTQHFEADAGGPARDFIAFEVKTPVPFPSAELGYPTIASKPDITSEETVQRPPPEPGIIEGLNPLGSASSALTSGLFWAGALTLAGVGLYAFVSRK